MDIEIAVEIIHRTEKAFMVKNLKDQNVWIPRSQISDYMGDEDSPETIFIPQWLAEEKELV